MRPVRVTRIKHMNSENISTEEKLARPKANKITFLTVPKRQEHALNILSGGLVSHENYEIATHQQQALTPKTASGYGGRIP